MLIVALRRDLKDVHRITQITQPMFAQIDQPQTVGKLIVNERFGRARNDDLTTVSCSHQPGASVDGKAGVAIAVDDSLCRVQSNPRFQWRRTPILLGESLFDGYRRRHRITGGRKCSGHSVAHSREHMAAMGHNRLL